nr:hypothetical protein CFP56_00362 [Quercus suber]
MGCGVLGGFRPVVVHADPELYTLVALLATRSYATPASNAILSAVTSDRTWHTRDRQYGIERVMPTPEDALTTVSSSTITPSTISVITTSSAGALVASAKTTFTTTIVNKVLASSRPICVVTVTLSDAAVSSTTTVYTGTDFNRVAKRIAFVTSAIDRGNLGMPGSAHKHGFPSHIDNFDTHTFEKDCMEEESTLFITTVIVTTLQTTTVTLSRAYITVTHHTNTRSPLTAPATRTTALILSPPTPLPLSSCITTTALPRKTTTQALECAPSNLLSAISRTNDPFIPITHLSPLDSNATQRLLPAADASACCQLCVDTQDCAAMASDASAGNCFLWFTAPGCGVAFRAQGGKMGTVGAGTGFVVQQGCGGLIIDGWLRVDG